MLAGAGRIAPFLLASAALHAIALVAAGPERLAIASAPAGDGRSVAVRLVAAGPPDTEPMPTDDGNATEHGGVATRKTAPAAREPPSAIESPDDDETTAARPDHARDQGEPGPEAVARAERTDAAPREAAEHREADTATGTRTSAVTPDEPDTEHSTEPADGKEPERVDDSEVAQAPEDAADADTRAEAEDAESDREPASDPDTGRTKQARAGNGGGSGGSDTTSARAERLRADVAAELAEHFRYPRLARSRGWEGQVVLTFRVHPDGRLSDVRVRESSGRAILDEAALQALRSVGRIPGVAERAPESTISLTLPVTYRLQSA